MPLQDVLDSDELADEVLAYCATLIRLLAGCDDLAVVRRLSSPDFNATVEVEQGQDAFVISLFDGLVQRVRAALDGLQSETIDDEMRTLAKGLLGGVEHTHICYRAWLVQALVFVVLHELAHVLCGHFSFLQQLGTRHAGTFTFSEIRDVPLLSDSPEEDPRILQLMELEADEVALDRMLVLAYELLMADETAKGLLSTRVGRNEDAEQVEDDVNAALRRQAEQLTFYAACTSMALIEAHGTPGPEHPPAFARTFNLVNTYVRRLLKANEGEPGVVAMQLTDALRQTLSATAAPALFNAMDIAETCCRVAGVELADRFSVAQGGSAVAGELAADLVRMLTGGSATTLSAEGALYAELRVLFADYNRRMLPHRRSGFL